MPVIIAMWHGQHFMAPFIKRDDERHRAKVLISRHRDGEINALAAERLGIGTIRGSGAHNGEFHRKGGVAAFTEMLEALEEGYNVALTADVPKVARVAGLGIVKLRAAFRAADLSGGDRHQPAHRARQLGPHRHQPAVQPHRAWWRASRSACRARRRRRRRWKRARHEVENELNRVTARAYAIADGTEERAAVSDRLPAALARLPAAVGGGDAVGAAAAGAAAAARQGASRARLPSGAATARMRAPAGRAGLAAWRKRRRTDRACCR